MTMNTSIEKQLSDLNIAISPPSHPLEVAGYKLVPGLPSLPLDLMKFVESYGSGYFEMDGSIFLEVLNPYSQSYWGKQNRDLDAIRELKKQEGDRYVPYKIFPEEPGLLLWGYGEDRKHFFWLTEGEPSEWPVIALHDLEVWTRFECSMLDFLKPLLCGEIDCDFIGGTDAPDNRIDPGSCQFVSELTPV